MKHALLDSARLVAQSDRLAPFCSAGTAAMGADELPVRSPDSDIELSSLTAQGKEAGEKTWQCPTQDVGRACMHVAHSAKGWTLEGGGAPCDYDIAVSIWDGFCEEAAMPAQNSGCAGKEQWRLRHMGASA